MYQLRFDMMAMIYCSSEDADRIQIIFHLTCFYMAQKLYKIRICSNFKNVSLTGLLNNHIKIIFYKNLDENLVLNN